MHHVCKIANCKRCVQTFMFRQISVLNFLRYISPYIPYVPGKSSIRRKKNHHFITVLFTGNQISLCTAQLFESNEWKIRRIPKRNEPILVGRLESSSRHACIFQRIRTGETSTRTSRRKLVRALNETNARF